MSGWLLWAQGTWCMSNQSIDTSPVPGWGRSAAMLLGVVGVWMFGLDALLASASCALSSSMKDHRDETCARAREHSRLLGPGGRDAQPALRSRFVGRSAGPHFSSRAGKDALASAAPERCEALDKSVQALNAARYSASSQPTRWCSIVTTTDRNQHWRLQLALASAVLPKGPHRHVDVFPVFLPPFLNLINLLHLPSGAGPFSLSQSSRRCAVPPSSINTIRRIAASHRHPHSRARSPLATETDPCFCQTP